MSGTTLSDVAQTPSHRVVEALAEATGTDPLTLEPPLYESIEPDALDEVIASGATGVSFEYGERTVFVESDGTVSVDGLVYDHEGGDH